MMKKGMMMKMREWIMKRGDERIGERDTGVEPASQAWEARALPMC